MAELEGVKHKVRVQVKTGGLKESPEAVEPEARCAA
mgnify:CR=1 FL=1